MGVYHRLIDSFLRTRVGGWTALHVLNPLDARLMRWSKASVSSGRANPGCTLVVRRRGQVACVTHEAEGAERDRAWQAANEQYSGYTVYQGRTDRRIPVVMLLPAAAPSG